MTVKHLEKLFSDDCLTDCFKFLEKAGFQIDKENNKLVYPEKLDLLMSLDVLLDCLSGECVGRIMNGSDQALHAHQVISSRFQV